MKGMKVLLSRNSQGASAITECAEVSSGSVDNKYFGIKSDRECWSGAKFHESYFSGGKSDNCTDGVGEPDAIFVYRFVGKGKIPLCVIP